MCLNLSKVKEIKVTKPQNKIKKLDIGKAWFGSNSSTPKIIEEYTAPPPMPHEVAKDELIIRIKISNNSRGYKGKNPLNLHCFFFHHNKNNVYKLLDKYLLNFLGLRSNLLIKWIILQKRNNFSST